MLQKNEGERGRRRGALELLRERQNELASGPTRRPQLGRQVQMSWCRRVCTGGQGGGRVGSQVPARVRLHAAYLDTLGPSFRCWVWYLDTLCAVRYLGVLGRCKVEEKSESVSYQRTPWMWCGGADKPWLERDRFGPNADATQGSDKTQRRTRCRRYTAGCGRCGHRSA